MVTPAEPGFEDTGPLFINTAGIPCRFTNS